MQRRWGWPLLCMPDMGQVPLHESLRRFAQGLPVEPSVYGPSSPDSEPHTSTRSAQLLSHVEFLSSDFRPVYLQPAQMRLILQFQTVFGAA